MAPVLCGLTAVKLVLSPPLRTGLIHYRGRTLIHAVPGEVPGCLPRPESSEPGGS